MLKAIIAALDEVDEALRKFYVQKGDKWELQVEGMKTPGDVERVQAALTKEKADHAKTKNDLKEHKEQLEAFGELKADEVHQKLTDYEALKATANGNPTEQQIQERIRQGVETQINSKTGPLKRDVDKLKRELDEANKARDGLQAQIHSKTIEDAIRSEAIKAKVIPELLDDVIALSRTHFKVGDDGKPITENGLDPSAFITDQKQTRAYWWPTTQGAGAQGSGSGVGPGGKNPWSHKDWDVTKQGDILKQNRPEAERLATLAGTSVGGRRPAPPAAQ